MLRHGYTHVAEFHYLHHDSVVKNTTTVQRWEGELLQQQNEQVKLTLVRSFIKMGLVEKRISKEDLFQVLLMII